MCGSSGHKIRDQPAVGTLCSCLGFCREELRAVPTEQEQAGCFDALQSPRAAYGLTFTVQPMKGCPVLQLDLGSCAAPVFFLSAIFLQVHGVDGPCPGNEVILIIMKYVMVQEECLMLMIT